MMVGHRFHVRGRDDDFGGALGVGPVLLTTNLMVVLIVIHFIIRARYTGLGVSVRGDADDQVFLAGVH